MDTKFCKTCGQEFPATIEYFYKHIDGLYNDCKSCYIAKRKNKRSGMPTLGKIGEEMAIQKLLSEGIFATSGKWSTWSRHVDVMCWGCIKVEVKYATERGKRPHWHWSMRSVANKTTDTPDFVLLIGEYNSGECHFYVFPANHPVFFVDGKRKLGITYTLNQINHTNAGYIAMKSWLMAEYENAFHLIETLRLERVKEFKRTGRRF